MEKEKIQERLLVAILPPDETKDKGATMLGIVKYLVKECPEDPRESIWCVRYGFDSGLTDLRLPTRKLIPIRLFSRDELLLNIPGGFEEMHPKDAFRKYYQEIKPLLSRISQHLDIEVLAADLGIEDLKTLTRSK
jgi:hypothetical protein